MRLKFGLPTVGNTVDTCIVVTEVALDGEMTVLGALVDSVQEVFELEPGRIEPAPLFLHPASQLLQDDACRPAYRTAIVTDY